MVTTEDKTQLVAYCGLHCGSCGSYRRGRCKSCKGGGGFSRCKVRICATEKSYQTCAECADFMTCKTLSNFISKIFAFIFRSDRKGNLQGIRELGIEKWASERAVSGKK